ncbi:hypothetical protein OT109_09140 [Phycisphaeraceae bacterium D3-23]
MAEDRATAGMVRVVVNAGADEENAEGMQEVARGLIGQVPRASKYQPRLFFLTSEQAVIGYVDYLDDHDGPYASGVQALQILEWAEDAQRVVSRADRRATRGRYAEALGEWDELLEQDRRVSHLIRVALGHTDAEEPTDDTPASPIFQGLREAKFAEYEAMAREQLDAARALADAGDDQAAMRLLRNLVRGPEAFSTTAEAKALYDEVVEKLRS